MRVLFGCVLAALAVGFGPDAAGREEKIDAKKLVGKWTGESESTGETVVMEFTKDGKLKITSKAKKEIQLNGTYTVDGDKLMVTLKAGDQEFKETLTIVKLTDDELVTKDSKGKKDTFERLEEKDQ